MPSHTISVPGTGDISASVGDTVVINFMEACTFCFLPATANYFSNPLPAAGQQHPAGSSWTGQAVSAGRGQTLSFWHSNPGGACIPVPAARRTITIGNTVAPIGHPVPV